jgi:hypothetical protein
MDLIPIACWKLNDAGFRFGSSFVTPETKPDFAALDRLCRQYPGAPMSVFGHADPVGDDAFNKSLSGHRARSIYAVLVRDVAAWESLWQSGGSEGWGRPAIEQMLAALGHSLAGGYTEAVKAFQREAGLTPVDGIAGPNTRAKLFAAYMDYLCEARWTPADFLGRGQDKNGRGDYQGCGEYNPYLVFSEAEEQAFQKAENREKRNAENAVNRRVVIYLFRPGTAATAAKWPCPGAAEGTEGCVRRLWQAARREYGETRDTFACRFYDRLAYESPCEGVEPKLVELVIPLEADLDGDPEEPDRVRLRQMDGGYAAELTVGDPEVVQDGDHPLYYYHFHLVPPGMYMVEVKVAEEWRTVLSGLQVSVQGAFFGGKSFEDDANGGTMGTPDYELADELDMQETPELGCC